MFIVIYHRKDNYMYSVLWKECIGFRVNTQPRVNTQRIYLYPHWDLSCVLHTLVYTA